MAGVKEFRTPVTDKPVLLGSGQENIIFAIESSCDDTAAAIVKNGRVVLSSVTASQIKTHIEFGGVVPEIAAHEHLEAVNAVIYEALKQAGLTGNDINAFAATMGPGLTGSLPTGLMLNKDAVKLIIPVSLQAEEL